MVWYSTAPTGVSKARGERERERERERKRDEMMRDIFEVEVDREEAEVTQDTEHIYSTYRHVADDATSSANCSSALTAAAARRACVTVNIVVGAVVDDWRAATSRGGTLYVVQTNERTNERTHTHTHTHKHTRRG